MRATLAGRNGLVPLTKRLECPRKRPGRRNPIVSLLWRLPRLWLASTQIATRIRRATEANLIPGVGVRVIGAHAILHEQHPIALDRHTLPDAFACGRRAVVNCLQDFLLLARRNLDEGRVPLTPGDGLYRLKTQPMRFAVRRHIFVAIAVNAPAGQSLVNHIDNWYMMGLVTVVLGDDAGADRLHQASFFRREKPNRRRLVNTTQHHLACRGIPEALLAQCGIPRVVARLRARRNRRAGGWVTWQPCGIVRLHIYFSLRNRLASKPSIPVAA